MLTVNKQYKITKVLMAIIGICLMLLGIYLLYTFYQSKKTSTIEQPALTKTQVTSIKKSDEQKQAYTVPPTHPRQLIIPKISIDANIIAIGVKADSRLDAPTNAWDVGWYQKSALPGSDSGALLIDGHINDALDQPGIFYNLSSLETDDIIQIERGDRQIITYRIIKVEEKPTATIDMAALLRSADPSEEGLNLITCGGKYDSKRQTYTHRTLVYAVRMR